MALNHENFSHENSYHILLIYETYFSFLREVITLYRHMLQNLFSYIYMNNGSNNSAW